MYLVYKYNNILESIISEFNQNFHLLVPNTTINIKPNTNCLVYSTTVLKIIVPTKIVIRSLINCFINMNVVVFLKSNVNFFNRKKKFSTYID